MAEEPKVPPTTPETPAKTPETTPIEPKTTPEAKTDTTDDIPEKFKGKTASEIAKSYLELEKKIGTNSKDVEETRKKLADWETLGKVIKSDPELEKQVLARIEKVSKGETEPDKKPDDTRKATEIMLINEFEKSTGINRLDKEKREAMFKNISNELADMVDPDGNKTIREVLDSIPLDKLPRYLDKAYRLATRDDVAEQSRVKAFMEAQNNLAGVFGSMPSGSAKKGRELTDKQKAVAKKQGLSEEEYAKQLDEMDKEYENRA